MNVPQRKTRLLADSRLWSLLVAAMLFGGALAGALSAQDDEGPGHPRPAVVDDGAPGAPKADGKKDLIPTDPIELFLAGGFLMWPILAASVVAVWIALERLVVLRRRRVIPRAFVDRFLQHLEQGSLDAESALQLCEENDSPVAHVFAHGIRKWGKPSVEVEQAIIDGGERQVGQLRNHLRILNGVYTVAPLLGLLGTVVGMIMSFNQLAQGGEHGKAEQLAGGIAVALLTTAAGLMVAIPALIIYMYLAGRVDSLVMEMDVLSQRVVNLISAEGLASRPRQTKPTPTLTKKPAPPAKQEARATAE